MSRLRQRLIENYAEHYRQVNYAQELDPRTARPVFLKRHTLMYGDLLRDLPAGSRVLDLGCGTGFMLYWLSQQPNVVPVGVDSSPSQIAVARQCLPNVELVLEEGLPHLRRNAGAFAGIFCTDVIEHIPGEDGALEFVEAAREALRPGGFFCCRVPNGASLLGSHSRYMDMTHIQCFTRSSLFQLLEAAGLKDCRVVPIRGASLTGSIRLGLEWLLHKAIFVLCGNALESVFTVNICAVGFRR
jgi:SAM-dependent methyltransferase